METLKMIFLGCLIVLGILLSIVFIIAILGVIFEPLTRKRKQKQAIENLNNFIDFLEQVNEDLDKAEEEMKSKKKTTKKSTKTKENE